MGKLLLLTVLAVAGGAIFFATRDSKPEVDFDAARKDGYFGAKSLKAGEPIPKDSTEIRPFKLSIPDSELQDLKSRLANARYVDHLEDSQFTYGFNSEYLKQVVEYWRTKYDWKKEEAKLNAYPQFITQIEGLDIHFYHVKASKSAKTVLPLLAIHGWPGSFLEYYKSLALLTEPDQNGIAFEVIVPSIPGHGYSQASSKKGFDAIAAARVFVKLLKRLGHEKFVVHGGDWGAFITKVISVLYPEKIVGAHVLGNMAGKPVTFGQGLKTLVAAIAPSLLYGSENAEREYSKNFPFGEKFGFMMAESGYFHIQATKPDTVAAGLVDSPVGMAAYILEKFSTWTNPANRHHDNGALTTKFTLDELLTNIMIYWTSGNIASSQRFYKENVHHVFTWGNLRMSVPSGTVDVPHEIFRSSKKLVEDYFDNLLQYSEFPTGGHFTAFEEPQLVTKDIKSFVKKVLDQQEQLKQEKEQKPNKDEV